MLDTYPYFTIPRYNTGCINPSTTGPSAVGALNGPLNVEIEVTATSGFSNSKTYHDMTSIPILINNYFASDVISIKISKYQWNNGVVVANIPSDYTISVYSKQLLKVLNPSSLNNQLYMDGRLPSGFTSS
jgi:hypothetical protein